MTQDLGSALNCDRMWDEHSFVLITQVEHLDSNFLSSYLLVHHLTAGRPVCLVTFTHTFRHYVNVASKFGLNLRSLRNQGKVVVVSVRKLIDGEVHKDVKHGSKSQDLMQLPGILSSAIQDAVNRVLELNKQFAVVLDDLSVLITLGIPLQDVLSLANCCKKLCWKRGCLVVTVCQDRLGEDTELLQLCHLLQHECDICVTVAELRSGFDNDVHGEMEIWWRNRSLKSSESKVTKHFKIEDKKIIVFAPGTSSAVL